MTQVIIDDITPRTQLVATGGQTVFNTNWTAEAETDVLVYARASGVEADDATQLVSSNDYNVTFVGGSETVRVTFLSGRTLGDIITIVRATPSDRENLYTNTNFTASMLNQDFGIQTLIEQQNKMYGQTICPGYNVSAIINATARRDTVLPILEPNQVWVMNDAGTAIEGYNVPSGGGIAPSDAEYLIRTPNADLPNATALSLLSTGFLASVSGTGATTTRTIAGTASQTTVTNGNGQAGNPTIAIADNPILPGTEGIGVSGGTTAQRPGSPANGQFRYNSTLAGYEYYLSTWNRVLSYSGTSLMTNGQLVIGFTAQLPVLGTLTAGPGISISNAPGQITISGTGLGFSWTEVTGTTQAMLGNNGYIANNAALVTLTLPATSVIGEVIYVQGSGAGGWRIAQNASQVIHFGNVNTTTGVGGSLSSTNRYDSIALVCVVANLEWAVLTGTQGIIDVT
jgi:hypothetical protein